MKVQVDATRCVGHGRCYAVAPNVFVPDEIGNAEVQGDGRVDPAEESRARLAVANCPEHAISVVDDD